jgi:transcriptional regulator with XRE-family HTH domain
MEYKVTKKRSNEIDKHISSRLAEIRKKKGVTRKQLGEYIGITVQQIQKYENGKNRISSGNLLVLAKALGVDILSFYEDYKNVVGYKKIPAPNEDLHVSITQNFVKIKHRAFLEALNVIVQGLVNPKAIKKVE